MPPFKTPFLKKNIDTFFNFVNYSIIEHFNITNVDNYLCNFLNKNINRDVYLNVPLFFLLLSFNI